MLSQQSYGVEAARAGEHPLLRVKTSLGSAGKVQGTVNFDGQHTGNIRITGNHTCKCGKEKSPELLGASWRG
jgi:hypothetical protein